MLYVARYALLLVYIAILLAAGISPAVRWIENHRPVPFVAWRPPRWLAVLAVYVAIFVAIAGIVMVILPPLVKQVQDLVKNLPQMLQQAQQFLMAHGFENEPLSVGEILQKAPSTDALTTILGTFWGLIGGIVGLIIIVILSLYLLIEADATFDFLMHLLPRERRPQVKAVASEVTQRVSAWMGGQLILCAIIGVSTATTLGLIGLPYFYVLAVIAAVGEFIPYAGPVLAALPGIAIALTISWKMAVVIALYYLGQQQIEAHVLVPKLMERQVGVSAAAVIIAIAVGTELLGSVGAILAVPSAAALNATYQVLRSREP